MGGVRMYGRGERCDSSWVNKQIVHSSIDHRNYFQVSKRHVIWIIYKQLIEFLHIVVWHMSVHSLARGHVIRV